MDRKAVKEVIAAIEKLDYVDKLSVYQATFGLGCLGNKDLNDKLVLFSLVALVTSKMRAKDSQCTPLKVLMQITGQIQDNSGFYQFLEALSIVVEDLMYETDKFDACGLKSSQEIISRIKELLDTWIPF